MTWLWTQLIHALHEWENQKVNATQPWNLVPALRLVKLDPRQRAYQRNPQASS